MTLRIRLLAVGILALLVSPVGATPDAPGNLDKLKKGFEAARAKLDAQFKKLRQSDEYTNALKAEEFEKLREMSQKLTDPFYEYWKEQARQVRAPLQGTVKELPVVAFMLENRLANDYSGLVKEMIENYSKSAQLGVVAANFRWMGRGMEKAESRSLLQRVIDDNPSVETKAHAIYARAMMVKYDREATDDEKKGAGEDLARITELLPADHLLSLRARGPEFARTRLQIGMEVPDIEGVDIAGTPFKLSDYRGKVVVLDFWGDW